MVDMYPDLYKDLLGINNSTIRGKHLYRFPRYTNGKILFGNMFELGDLTRKAGIMWLYKLLIR